MKVPEQSEADMHHEEVLRRTVRRSLRNLRLPALRALIRAVRYAEEGKTPMAIAAEDLATPYKVEAIFREADRLRSRPHTRRGSDSGDDETSSLARR